MYKLYKKIQFNEYCRNYKYYNLEFVCIQFLHKAVTTKNIITVVFFHFKDP